MRNRAYYACASYWHGRACMNKINESRTLVETVMLDGIREDLSDPAVIAEIERRVRTALKQWCRPKIDHGKRIVDLRHEIENHTDAIAAGQLRGSPTIAKRLVAAEAELLRLNESQTTQNSEQ